MSVFGDLDDPFFDELPVDRHSCRLLGPTALVGRRAAAVPFSPSLQLIMRGTGRARLDGVVGHFVAGVQAA